MSSVTSCILMSIPHCHCHIITSLANTLDRWHPTLPNNHTITEGITHVIVAFADPLNFTMANYSSLAPPVMSADKLRAQFDDGTKVGIALGGWGLFSSSFSIAATPENRCNFSANLASWMEQNGYDFVGE